MGSIVALSGFSLTVCPGEVVGLVGENGAGKTTFARAVVGLVSLDAGTVRVAGVDVAGQPRMARAAVGWAPQELALYPTITARDNLLVFGGLSGLGRSEAIRRASELGVALELTDVLDRPVGKLSGGQQRRVQAATAMIHRPAVLLLDEPTVGADPITRQAVLFGRSRHRRRRLCRHLYDALPPRAGDARRLDRRGEEWPGHCPRKPGGSPGVGARPRRPPVLWRAAAVGAARSRHVRGTD